MAVLASDWLIHFWIFLRNRWLEFDETWQETRTQRPIPICVFWAEPLIGTFSTSHIKPLNGIQRNLTDINNLSSFSLFVPAFFQTPFVSDFPSVCYFAPRTAEKEIDAILKSWFVLSFGILEIFPRQEMGRKSLEKIRCTATEPSRQQNGLEIGFECWSQYFDFLQI